MLALCGGGAHPAGVAHAAAFGSRALAFHTPTSLHACPAAASRRLAGSRAPNAPNGAARKRLCVCVRLVQECEFVQAFPSSVSSIEPPAGPLRHLLASPPAGTPLPPAGLAPSDSMASARVAVNELDKDAGHHLRELMLLTLAVTTDPAWLGLPGGEPVLPALPEWLLRLEPADLVPSAIAKWVRGAAEGRIVSGDHSASAGWMQDGQGSFLVKEPFGSVQEALESFSSIPLNVRARIEALLALPWFPSQVADFLQLEPDTDLGLWRVRPSADPLCMSPAAMLAEARTLFAQQHANLQRPPNSVLRFSPRSPREGQEVAGGGAQAMSVSHTRPPASGAPVGAASGVGAGAPGSGAGAAPSAPCVLHGHGHTNAECRAQHGGQALGAGGGKRSREAGGQGPHKRGGGRGGRGRGAGGGGRGAQSDRTMVAMGLMESVTSIMNSKPPHGLARGRGAR